MTVINATSRALQPFGASPPTPNARTSTSVCLPCLVHYRMIHVHCLTSWLSFLRQMLSHEAQVLKQGLTLLTDVLTSLEPLISRSEESPLSILLHEVASSGRPQQAMASMQLTPLLHGIVAAHAYISMFLHVCKVGQVRVWFVVAIIILIMVM